MNLSLHKVSFKKYVFLFLFFLGLGISFSRCVPIEDLVAPTVGEFTLQEQYNISDTIILNAILADNFGISNYTVDIEAVNGAGLWSYSSIDSVKARLLNLKDTIIIPSENFAIGNYKLTLTVFDASGKSKIITKNFSVGKDNSIPILTDIKLDLDLSIDLSITFDSITKVYTACRLNIIPIKGKATDNTGIKKVVAQFDGIASTRKDFIVNSDTLKEANLSTIFIGLNSISVPPVYDNGDPITNETPLKLRFTVTDTEGNTSSAVLSFLIDCDDESPVIDRIDTNIKNDITTDGDSIVVIQGQELFITGGKITDDQELDSLIIYLEDKSERETVIVPLFSNAISGDSYTIDNDIPIFSFRSTPRIGKVYYNLKVKSIDAVGNESSLRDIKLFIEPNEPPSVIPTLIEVDGIPISNPLPFNINNPITVSTGSTIRLYGKISDDLKIEEYEIRWGKTNEENLILAGTANNFTYDNATVGIINVSNNANRLDIYKLTISAKDILGVENQVTYYFRVQ